MAKNLTQKADYIFECSWEVCNKIGGIHTVIATKATTVVKQWGDHYILIGPDLARDKSNSEFIEDNTLMSSWRNAAYTEGLRIRVGRWDIPGSPIVVLVDMSSFISHKDAILGQLWADYQVDSLSGGWDYVEPVLFGYAAGKTIESFVALMTKPTDMVVCHFHEWMTASGGLYLKKHLPSVATVFTTHATVMGRCIAGNGLPLYGHMESYNADAMAHQWGVQAKHSIEKAAANNFDAFTTVSDITADECQAMLGKAVSCTTPNGFENSFVPKGKKYDTQRSQARELLIHTAEVTLGYKFEKEPLIISTSGRYEFKNKGLDEFIDSLGMLNQSDKLERDILAYIMVPCWNHGPRRDLQAALKGDFSLPKECASVPLTTHYLGDQDNDPVVGRLRYRGLLYNEGKVKVVFVPCYLNGDDGIFNKAYYDLLIGMDVTVFPSYYEPWGYTPLESIAFGVPTITTTLAGFGLWVMKYTEGHHDGVTVIPRDDTNSQELTNAICESLLAYAAMGPDQLAQVDHNAQKLAEIALWSNLFQNYLKAYDVALSAKSSRDIAQRYDGGAQHEQVNFVRQQLLSSNRPNWSRLIVERTMPDRIKPLDEMTKNLWWSWTDAARQLFESIAPETWPKVERNPIALLDTLSSHRLKELASDEEFLSRMDMVYARFKKYMSLKGKGKGPKVAYFSMEYGLHSSLKIYSGGLGILAGDYLKESSDKNVPLTAVGLLYRYGYFTQRLSSDGGQEASYEAQNFDKLAITPVRDENGQWKTISVSFPGRTVTARIWRCDVGRTELYLLDTDHDLNLEEDRSITHHLYGGDWDNRLKQEFLLGIGGIRTLETLGVESDVYHCNEGHAAFIGLERIRNFESQNNLSFSEALEAVRSSSLFTTHTPVPAGHDAFDEGMIRQYMWHYPERLKITWEQFINLGKTNPNDPNQKFSMSVLAANLSQEVNGVSWLHGQVSKDILGSMWPGYMPSELHIGYVTNGVHFPTWTATRLKDLYYKHFGEDFKNGDYSKKNWDKIHTLPDEQLWDVRLYLKNRLIKLIRRRVADPTQFKFDSPRQMLQIQEQLRGDVLTIGFARRFATYKRAHLLFTNMERLAAIVNNPERPVQFVFAGKAHPADKAGQDLIKRIVEVSKMPQFVGKVIFLQNYDIELARRMVQGVDIWMNTPTRPLEASGTSGEKAVMNGVMHFSVLDGWWVEGYKKGAGWMLPMERTFDDQHYQDELDAEMIYNTIEEQIAPLYYDREVGKTYSQGWMETVKNCISEVASQFTTNRMMQDYEDRYYSKLYERNSRICANNFELVRQIASWKRRVSLSWDKVHVVELRQYDINTQAIFMGGTYNLECKVDIDGLKPEDIGVELVVASQITTGGKVNILKTHPYQLSKIEGSIATFILESVPDTTGSYDVATRVYAKNEMLAHRMDFALVKWA
ncbi:MAG: alpha-glucan family phosphorylase [Mucinivorans sp.]